MTSQVQRRRTHCGTDLSNASVPRPSKVMGARAAMPLTAEGCRPLPDVTAIAVAVLRALGAS